MPRPADPNRTPFAVLLRDLRQAAGPDLTALSALLEEGARLLTLTGVSGVGKTRLAVALDDSLARLHPNGTVMVSLAALSDSDAALPSVARALALSAGQGPAQADELASGDVLLGDWPGGGKVTSWLGFGRAGTGASRTSVVSSRSAARIVQ